MSADVSNLRSNGEMRYNYQANTVYLDGIMGEGGVMNNMNVYWGIWWGILKFSSDYELKNSRYKTPNGVTMQVVFNMLIT